MLKVNDRFGNVTIVAIKKDTLELICSCGHMFKRSKIQAEKKGIRTQCADCCKAKVGIKMPERNMARAFSEKESRYIDDFEKGKTNIKRKL